MRRRGAVSGARRFAGSLALRGAGTQNDLGQVKRVCKPGEIALLGESEGLMQES